MAEEVHLEALAHEVFIGRVLQKHSIVIIRRIQVTHPRVAPAGLSAETFVGSYTLASIALPHAFHLSIACMWVVTDYHE